MWVVGLIFAGSIQGPMAADAVETELSPDPGVASAPEVPQKGVAYSLQVAVTEALELLQKYGLSFDSATAPSALIEALVKTADPTARLLSENDARYQNDAAAGISYDTGIHFTRSNGLFVVTWVDEESPAAEAGIRPNDILLQIDGKDASKMDTARVQALLRSEHPGQVEIRISGPEDEPNEHSLNQRRKEIKPIEEQLRLPADLAYLRVNGLFEGTGERIAGILIPWKEAGVDGIVLDLRGANGTDLQSVVDIASLTVLPDTELFSFHAAAERDVEVHRSTGSTLLNIPMMILVDDKTRAASELLAATLSGFGRGAMLLGSRTSGDPMIRDQVGLSDGSILYIATRVLITTSGVRYAGTETVKPDIRVNHSADYPDYEPSAPVLTDHREVTPSEIETRDLRTYMSGDVSLTRAVDVLMGLKALNLHSFDRGGSKNL